VSAVLLAALVVAAAVVARQARLAGGRSRARGLRPVAHVERGRAWAHAPSRWPAVVRATARRAPDALARRRNDRLVARGMPDALDELARALRSGATLGQALQEVGGAGGPARTSLAELGRRGEHGAGLAGAASTWAAASPTAEVRAAAAAISLGASGVASPAIGVEAVAGSLRARHAMAAEVRAHSAQARLSAAVLAVLPVAFTGWVALTQPAAVQFLLGTPAGLTCLALGLALEAAGVLWIVAIVRDAG